MGKKDKKGKAHEVAPAGEQDGDDAGHSGGLLFGSSLDTRIRPLLDAVDSIRNLLQGASLNITLPSIVVAGDQSAGKTSLLEALSGVQLPRGDDIVTRCPLILRLHLDATAKKATLSARDENGGDAGGRLAEREIALEEIDAAVREFQDILAGDQAEQGVKNLPISLDIWRPDVVDLTIIDLPGITHVATGAQPEDIAEQIKEMISEYIEPAEAVILCACPATQDITNNIVIKMARAVDPEGKRTIGVITKADLLASDTVIQSVIGAGDGRGLTFQLGCFATLARTPEQLANDTPHAEIRAAESRFFASNGAWRVVPASRLGVEALAAKLQEIQVERIRETLPNIRRAIADELAKLSKERDGLPPLMTDNPTRRAYVIKIARDIGRDIHSIWHDTGDRVDDALNAPARLKEMREFASMRMGRVCNYLGIEYGHEVKKFMVESAGRGLPNFISVPAFCQMVKTELPAYEDICLDLVQGYHEYMVAFMEEILRRNVDYAAADATFANWIESVCLGAVDRQVEVIKERLEEMFEAEAAQPITHNSYYMSTQTKVSAAIQDAREEPPKNYIREINDYRLDLSTVDISTLLSDSDEERLHYQISMHAYMKVVSKRVIDWAALMCNAKLPMFFVTKVEELVTDAVLQDDDTLERILPVDRHLLHRRTYVERTLTALREAENEIVPLFAGALPSDRGSASGLSIRGRGFRGVLATTVGNSGAGQQWDDPPLLRTPVINVQKTHVFEVAGVTLTLGLSGGEVPCPQLVPSEDIRLRFKITNREGTVLVNHSNELVSIATNGVSFPNLGVVHGVLTIYEVRED